MPLVITVLFVGDTRLEASIWSPVLFDGLLSTPVQEDLLGTKVKKVLLVFTYIKGNFNSSHVYLLIQDLALVPQEILVTAPELHERDGMVQRLSA